MLKIFQTGDNHVGWQYARHENRETLISARTDAFETMVSVANQENCDLFVITGDLFQTNRKVPQKTIRLILDMLAQFQGTVVVLPGNHDYYDKDSDMWQHFEDYASTKGNIMLLKEYRPYSLPVNDGEAVLYPALCTSLHSDPNQNNLGWIKAENIIPDHTYRIGIAHGAVQGETIDNEGQYFLMSRSELESIPVDVWLIGHTHVPFPDHLTEEFLVTENILNAGTHVQTDVSCNTEGVCFIVTIDEDKTVRAKKVISGTIRFYRKNITLSAGNMEETLRRELESIDDHSVVDLVLSGAVTEEEYENVDTVVTDLLSRFIEGSYRKTELSKLISEDLIRSEFAETSLSAQLLSALLDEPKEAQLAYELLKSLKENK